MPCKIFKDSQTLSVLLFETNNEQEAKEFCEQNNWEMKDENGFLWDLHYE